MIKFEKKMLKCVAAATAFVTLQSHAAESLYMIYMNPFEVQKYEQAAINAGYSKPQIPVKPK